MEVRKSGAVGSLMKALRILRANPSLLLIAFLWVSFSQFLTYLGGESFFIYLILIIPMVFIYPYIKGGFFSIVIKAQNQEEKKWFNVFKKGGKDQYVSLLIGGIAYIGIVIGFFIIFYITTFLGTIAIALIFGLIGKLVHELLSLALIIIAMLVFLPLFTGILVCFQMFIQFYDIGIVVKGFDVDKSFKKSFNFARTKFNSVLGFTFLKYGIMFALYLPILIYEIQNIPLDWYQTDPLQIPSNPFPVVVLTMIFFTIFNAFTFTYHSTFYVQNIEEVEEAESRNRILLKLYGIGFLMMILFIGIMAATFLLFGPELEEFAKTSAELAAAQQV